MAPLQGFYNAPLCGDDLGDSRLRGNDGKKGMTKGAGVMKIPLQIKHPPRFQYFGAFAEMRADLRANFGIIARLDMAAQ